jgi:uroporphyrinogen III methyltransferase/synthase
LRGKAVLERADVVLYDRLAASVLWSVSPTAGQERIHVGKTAGGGLDQQDRINALLVEHALGGARVARLKGGDPFIMGRGAEEALHCATNGVPFEVIPGVSAVSAVPAYAGIPLTYRELASGFTVLTGHERWDTSHRIDWRQVAGQGGTILVLMAVLEIERWTAGLLEGGLAPQTPVGLVRWGTLPRQELLVSTLERVAGEVREHRFRPPAVAVVGEVVGLAGRLDWMSARPLRRLVVALPRVEAGEDAGVASLEAGGATVLALPLTVQRPIDGGRRLAEALGEGRPTDLVVTSARGAEVLGLAMTLREVDARWWHGIEVWAVGPATAQALGRLGLLPDRVGEGAGAAGLLRLAERVGVAGRRFLHPASSEARPELARGLRALGAEVRQVAAYETVDHPEAAPRLRAAIELGLGMVGLTSPSAADALCRAASDAGVDLGRLGFAAIGPTTAAHARKVGLRVEVVPDRTSLAAMVEAIALWARAQA